MLTAMYEEKPQDWDEHLESLAYSLRVMKIADTELSPFQLMYNRVPRHPSEVSFYGQVTHCCSVPAAAASSGFTNCNIHWYIKQFLHWPQA